MPCSISCGRSSAFHAAAHRLGWRVVPSSLSVRSDPRLLEQMIRNLLSNAVKYTSQGKILLGCRRRGDMLRIEVWDTGIGIPEEQLQEIFEEFRSARQSGARAQQRARPRSRDRRAAGRPAGAHGRCSIPPWQGLGLCRRGAARTGCAALAATPVYARGNRTQTSERHNPGRRGRSLGARDAGACARRRGLPHDYCRGRAKGAGIGGARRGTARTSSSPTTICRTV